MTPILGIDLDHPEHGIVEVIKTDLEKSRVKVSLTERINYTYWTDKERIRLQPLLALDAYWLRVGHLFFRFDPCLESIEEVLNRHSKKLTEKVVVIRAPSKVKALQKLAEHEAGARQPEDIYCEKCGKSHFAL